MRNISKIFSIYLFIIGLSAVFGGWMIIYTNWMQFPPDLLSTTPFHSFIIPGIILAFIVGGAQIIGSLMVWSNNRLQYEAAAFAGFTLLVWMCTEIFLIPSHHWIQIVYLAFSLITLICVMFFLKNIPSENRR